MMMIKYYAKNGDINSGHNNNNSIKFAVSDNAKFLIYYNSVSYACETNRLTFTPVYM